MTRWLIFGFAMALASTGCSRSNSSKSPESGGVGVVRGEIGSVPAGVLCVQLITTVGTHTLTNDFDVQPGQPATLDVTDVPAGDASVSAWAFAAGCALIGSQPATWTAAPQVAAVHVGEVTPLPLTLTAVGGGDGGVLGGGDGGTTGDMDHGCGCSAQLLCCDGMCVDPSHDPKNCGGCGNVCGSGRCGTELSSAFADWSFNGNATYDPTAGSFLLTPAAASQIGSVVYKSPIVTGDFDVQFDFRITPSSMSNGVADGMGFMIEQNGPTALGTGGGGFGMTTLTGYGIELDTFNNANPANGSGGCGDTNGNHTAVDSLNPCTDFHGGLTPTMLATSSDLHDFNPSLTLSDGQWHTCEARFTGGQMTVLIDAVARVHSPLTGFVAGKSYYFGFAGGTGGSFSRQEVRNPQVTFFAAQCI